MLASKDAEMLLLRHRRMRYNAEFDRNLHYLHTSHKKAARLINQIYPTELQLNLANSLDIEAPFLDLGLSLT